MTTPAPARKSSGIVIPRKLSWHRRIMASAAALIFWLLIKSWRRVWKHTADNSRTPAPVIYCVWHNHLVLALSSYEDQELEKWNEKGLVAMVSASGDGAFLAIVLVKFGIQTVRGSTSRRGPQALLEAARWLRKGYSVAITPDGPRGPSQIVQDGIIYLAQVSGRPIVPVSNFTPWKIRLRSWDRFQIPLPFAKCELCDNGPISVPRDITDEEREKLRLQLEESMRAITRD
jgi:lysophospholipid acyltransferase (LPLAT)-like uncharacterized protein